MASYPIRNRHWTRVEYEKLVDSGVFRDDEHLELIGGQMLVAEPKGTRHAVTVVRGRHRDYLAAHPATAALIVEVAESSLAFDRRHKGGVYARAGVADYWIVNLIDDVLEVYRDPSPDPGADFGWRYASVTLLRGGATIVPLARPDVTIPVAGLLP